MNSERLKTIVSKVREYDTVLDVGCDHGYVSIMLKENHLCKEVYASDISSNALNFAKTNFQKHNLKIKTFVSDGFKNIPVFFDTAIIAGMGTNTILKILKHSRTPDKLIIASNNDYYLLRKSLNKLGYKIVTEEVVYEKEHFYVILLAFKGHQHLNRKELLYGISNNDEYYTYLLEERKKLLDRVPFKKRLKLYRECYELKGLIERK